MKRLPKAYSREKRKDQIKLQFRVWIDNGDTEPKTMYRIARALGMTPSVKIYAMLDELIVDGYLTMESRDQSGRWTTRFYYPVVTTLITEKYGKRRINVKRKGVVSGQLEMWT
jgi:hypothetical protein